MLGGAWMAAAVVVALVLQFAAYWWLRKRTRRTDPRDLFGLGDPEGADASAARPGTCPTCGTENDPEYTFCRHCGGRISG